MARSSKGFNELRQLHQLEQSERQMMTKVQQKVQEGALGETVKGVVRNPKGQVKMSKVLEKFIDPYLDDTKTFEERDTLVNLAVIAWNLALMPEVDRQKEMDNLFKKASNFEDVLAQKEAKGLIEEMIDRKLEYFANIQRFIVDFEIKETGSRLNLVVVSTPTPPQS